MDVSDENLQQQQQQQHDWSFQLMRQQVFVQACNPRKQAAAVVGEAAGHEPACAGSSSCIGQLDVENKG
jgi:hypothetical protein